MKDNMNQCHVCQMIFSRRDAMLRHFYNVHQGNYDLGKEEKAATEAHTDDIEFQHPFTMVVTGPSGSGKSHWTRQLLLSDLIHSQPQRILWCYGQWQPLYNKLQRELSSIEFIQGIPDRLTDPDYIDGTQRVVIIFDDLMTEAKCDQRIADLYTKGSHHRNISVVYLTQNLFPQGKACRDIALNTQYLVLFNNPIDRQQVATLARRIYPTRSHSFMTRFEEETRKPYGYLLVDLKARTPEYARLKSDIFHEKDTDRSSDHDNNSLKGGELELRSATKRPFEEDESEYSDIMEEDRALAPKMMAGPPGKVRRGEISDVQTREAIWNRRFKEPLRQANNEQFKANVDENMEQGYSFHDAVHHAANEIIPQLRKKLRQKYAQFLTDFYELQSDPTHRQIIQTAENLRSQHDMKVSESLRQAVKLRKDLFIDVWPDHAVDEDCASDTDEDETT